MRFLITAGPTREHIDDVRFISNPSTGRMGYAVAAAAMEAGHIVTLVAGPTALPDPDGAEVAHVTSTRELCDAVMGRLPETDVFVAAAAPCDFRPDERQAGKVKKGASEIVLRLVANPDVLYEVGRRKESRVLIGVAMEVEAGRANALSKLKRKNLDAVVLNAPDAFGSETTTATLMLAEGDEENLAGVPKESLARRLVSLAETIWKERNP